MLIVSVKNKTCSWKNGKYLANSKDDYVITCDEIIDAKAK